MNEKIYEELLGIVADCLAISPDSISAEKRFVSDLGADSLDMIEIIMNAEEAFGVIIPDDDEFLADKKFGELVEYIATNQKP